MSSTMLLLILASLVLTLVRVRVPRSARLLAQPAWRAIGGRKAGRAATRARHPADGEPGSPLVGLGAAGRSP
jgi:hypothetical protein